MANSGDKSSCNLFNPIAYSSAKAGTEDKREVMLDKSVTCVRGHARYRLEKALHTNWSISDDFYYAVKNLPLTYSHAEYLAFLDNWGTVSN